MLNIRVTSELPLKHLIFFLETHLMEPLISMVIIRRKEIIQLKALFLRRTRRLLIQLQSSLLLRKRIRSILKFTNLIPLKKIITYDIIILN